MPSEKQSERLPVTTSSIITESKGTFLGLDGMSFFIVMIVFVTVGQLKDFLWATIASLVVFVILRVYVSGRPDNFLRDWILYWVRPKTFEHRPRSKRPVLRLN